MAAAPIALIVLLGAACGQVAPSKPGDGSVPDGYFYSSDCHPDADPDQDGIDSLTEGCREELDSDGDAIPDYLDRDSDNDHISDTVDFDYCGDGPPPPDTDGDGLADFRDPDADNDGIPDGQENRGGSERLGACEQPCDPAAAAACGELADCNPVHRVCVNAQCLEGRTDPCSADTDADGLPDPQDPVTLCGEDPGLYLWPVGAGVTLALGETVLRDFVPTDASELLVTTLDDHAPDHPLAGASLTRPATALDAAGAQDAALAALQGLPGVAVVEQRSGEVVPRLLEDIGAGGRYLVLQTANSTDLGTLRNRVLRRISGAASAILPPPAGITDTRFVLGILTLRRPADPCEPALGDAIVHVLTLAREPDATPGSATADALSDFTSGAAVAWQRGASLERECEYHPPPTADPAPDPDPNPAALSLLFEAVPSSLRVGVERRVGDHSLLVEFPRHPDQGFRFAPQSNAVTLAATALTPTDRAVVYSYLTWTYYNVPCWR